jgi:hypothetical protein
MFDDRDDDILTPLSVPPKGYKLLVHRYYTEIVPVNINIPKTPIKKRYDKFFFKESKNKENNNIKS